MPLDQVVADVEVVLRGSASVADACQATLDVIARYGDPDGTVLLPSRDHLHTVAAIGSWHVFSTFAPGIGVVGRVYASGVTETVSNINRDLDYIALNANIEVEICAPILDCTGHSIGALNLEWTSPIDVTEWQRIAEEAGRALGTRIQELSGPPPESRSEKLLRHALALTTAGSEVELLARSLDAARDVSGLCTPVLLLTMPDGIEVNIDEVHPTPLATKIAAIDHAALATFIDRARVYGASYSTGDPARLNSRGFECLIRLGVRTMIAVPVGVSRERSSSGGVLLVVDEEVSRPDAEIVNLMSLLAAQAWSSLKRLQTLHSLRQLASSDPLTGLRHQGSFAERLAHANPGRTAVFAIDIDSFKNINDTYGHQAGDRALVELAHALSSTLRAADELYRIGGDEFAAVVDVAWSEEAVGVADRLVTAARNIGHTISVGVAIQHEGETAQETLSRADAALYVAKRSGRDGVRLAA